MERIRVLYFSLAAAVAALAASVIFIIVDQTTYCREGSSAAVPFTAVSYISSNEATVICLPDYVFVDGNSTHKITCDTPPHWNWENVPPCIAVEDTVAVKCLVQSADSKLTGEMLFIQEKPASQVHIQGFVSGLTNAAVQLVDVDNHQATCHVTADDLVGDTGDFGLNVTGNVLHIDVTTKRSLMMNETFKFFIRAIGSAAVPSAQFDGVVFLILEQHQHTVGVFSTATTIRSII